MATFRTTRFVLGPFAPQDLDAIHRWRNDSEILEMSADDTEGSTLEESRNALSRWTAPRDDIAHFAIRLADSDQIIGFFHLAMIDRQHDRCRVGIVIGEKELWGQGYGTESLRAAVGYAFETLGMQRITAETYSTNPRSMAMLESVGFRREGVMRESIVRAGRRTDEVIFGLLQSDWARSRSEHP